MNHVSVDSGALSGGTEVRLRGKHLDSATGVRVGANEARITAITSTRIDFVAPAANDFRPGRADIALEIGQAVYVFAAFRYIDSTPTDHEMLYLFQHWDHRNVDGFGSLAGTDCVNFTSQGLLARGWTMDADTSDLAGWWFWKGTVTGAKNYSSAWISSTAMMRWLERHHELATRTDLDHAAIGDIVQFDWDHDGNPNHTGVVSRVDDGSVWVVQHSDDEAYASVDDELGRHPGAVAWVWHLR